jgi:transcriptional regulator with PAS, ATPase and Fis domain
VINSYTIRHALLTVGLKASGGNYKRIKSLIVNKSLEFKKSPKQDFQKKRMDEFEKKYGSFQAALKTKIKWPPKEELESMIKNQSVLSISKKLKVSDNAVRKTAKRYGIDIKSLSKWSQKHGDLPYIYGG